MILESCFLLHLIDTVVTTGFVAFQRFFKSPRFRWAKESCSPESPTHRVRT
jgi:hypothetical protein